MVQFVKRGSIEFEWDQPVEDVLGQSVSGELFAFNTHGAYKDFASTQLFCVEKAAMSSKTIPNSCALLCIAA